MAPSKDKQRGNKPKTCSETASAKKRRHAAIIKFKKQVIQRSKRDISGYDAPLHEFKEDWELVRSKEHHGQLSFSRPEVPTKMAKKRLGQHTFSKVSNPRPSPKQHYKKSLATEQRIKKTQKTSNNKSKTEPKLPHTDSVNKKSGIKAYAFYNFEPGPNDMPEGYKRCFPDKSNNPYAKHISTSAKPSAETKKKHNNKPVPLAQTTSPLASPTPQTTSLKYSSGSSSAAEGNSPSEGESSCFVCKNLRCDVHSFLNELLDNLQDQRYTNKHKVEWTGRLIHRYIHRNLKEN